MRRLMPWVGAFLVAVLAGGGAVVVLNATVFGPGDFVRVYLDALARGDAAGALGLPGVNDAGADDGLLADDVLTGVADVRQVSDEALGHGRHRITMAWTTPGGAGTTAFEVERVGTRLGLFPEWGFSVSPVAVLALEVLHDARFTANGVDATTALTNGQAAPAEFAVLVPGSYTLAHESTYLTAAPVTVVAGEPGQVIDATVDVQPTSRFSDALADEVERHLDACAQQTVLFPTGCPFGQAIANRVVSEPMWTIVHVPDLDVEPGPGGAWTAGPAPGTAHLVVDVQSLFDGSVSTFDQDVPFRAQYTVVIAGEDLRITETDPED